MNVESVSSARTQLQSESAAPKVTNSKPAGTEGAAQDRTTLQSGSSSVQLLASAALQSPQIRQDKVEALQQSVRGGNYQVDASQVAGAISGSGGR